MEIRKVSTMWPTHEYAIIRINHGYALFEDGRTLKASSSELKEVESKLNHILQNQEAS